MNRESWYLIPFIEQILVIASFLAIAPAIWGIYEISRGHYLGGAFLILVWGLFFLPFARFLDRRKIAHIFITLPGAGIIIILFAWLFFA